MLVWAVHDGGYDADTWYWGALVLLALLTAIVVARRGSAAMRLSRAGRVALVAFALYVGLVVSVDHLGAVARRRAHGQQPGAALPARVRADARRCPWTAEGRWSRCSTFALGVGVIGDRAAVPARRRPTTSPSLSSAAGWPRRPATSTRPRRCSRSRRSSAIALAARRELPGLLRGAPDRVRLRRPAARADRPEPRLAVHAAAGRDRRDRGRPGPAAGRGRGGPARSPARCSPFHRLLAVYQTLIGAGAQPRRRPRRARGAR